MEQSNQILSDITHYMKYAKYLPEKKRRETWHETVARNHLMHRTNKKFNGLADELSEAYKYVYDRKVLPSMRSMQFAGKPISNNPSRIFNCAYLPADDWRTFSEIMFLLLGGTGVGFSVQRHHVEKMPEIKRPSPRKRRYLIGDSIEGWADAVKHLVKSYFYGTSEVVFDYSDIRAKGSRLITSGGKAPGPQPLHDCLHNLRKILNQKQTGDKLSTLEVHDMICYIADAVLAGGIRRAALLSLFSFDDEDMLSCKFGKWWEKQPQRARANNSVTVLRHRIEEEEFQELWQKIKAGGAGEPGIYFTNNQDWGCNPCCEIALRPFQFCNLTTIDASDLETQEQLEERVRAAAFIGTIQASYTDFHYLRDVWRRNTEKDSLIGVSMTGICSGKVLDLDLKAASKVVKEENERVSKIIGINKGARTTCIKPEGTASLVLGCSSGIHAWHANTYIRRIRVGKNEPIYQYLQERHPQLVEDDYFKPHIQAVISIPQKAPHGSILRSEDVSAMLGRIKHFSREWVRPGHSSGQNRHNVSATVSVKEDEWQKVGAWMWKNRLFYNGLAVLPHDGGTYTQAPFEDCDEDTYIKMMESLTEVDLSQIKEEEDNTNLKGELACSGGVCNITEL
jgi:ribonucleoside-diphosphate reductase alpha chain